MERTKISSSFRTSVFDNDITDFEPSFLDLNGKTNGIVAETFFDLIFTSLSCPHFNNARRRRRQRRQYPDFVLPSLAVTSLLALLIGAGTGAYSSDTLTLPRRPVRPARCS